MSTKYPGGIISKTAPTPSGPYSTDTAPGVWTLEQQAYWQKLGQWPTAGNTPPYIEDVFSTWLYTGNGTTQTITNGIDLAGKGGMVWGKTRNAVVNHTITDTVRGVDKELFTNTTDAQVTRATGTGSVYAFNSNGFSTSGVNGFINYSGYLECAWTFRKQPKFFDVVTYTGNSTGTQTQNISHSLGSVPGCIIVKKTSGAADWYVYHRSLGPTYDIFLNATLGALGSSVAWNNTTPTSTVFTVGTDSNVNQSGQTYVAYLFAHNAGGFGLTGTDNVISCGSFTTDGSGNATVTLGYEPQYVMLKCSSAAQGWIIEDTMRGASYSATQGLFADTSGAEFSNTAVAIPTATGFVSQDGQLQTSQTYIYIAIRRGPMKVPTSGTSVFGTNARSGTGANATVTGGQTDDAVLVKNRGSAVADLFSSRLTGTGYLVTSSTAAEVAAGTTILQANPWDVMDGVKVGTTSTITNASGNTFVNYLFRRAPSFFDEVCYTGTGSDLTLNHNLQAVPQMIICKSRSTTDDWPVYQQYSSNGFYGGIDLSPPLNGTTNYSTLGFWKATPTSSVFYLPSNTYTTVNEPGQTYVAYLFATCAGVSKVGSYTGTGALQTVNCGFTSGARFVLIRRTDSTGNWYVYDSARGITSGNDPYLLLNSINAEVTGTNYVDTDSTGFKVTAAAPAGLNASGGTYIFLAIA